MIITLVMQLVAATTVLFISDFDLSPLEALLREDENHRYIYARHECKEDIMKTCANNEIDQFKLFFVGSKYFVDSKSSEPYKSFARRSDFPRAIISALDNQTISELAIFIPKYAVAAPICKVLDDSSEFHTVLRISEKELTRLISAYELKRIEENVLVTTQSLAKIYFFLVPFDFFETKAQEYKKNISASLEKLGKPNVIHSIFHFVKSWDSPHQHLKDLYQKMFPSKEGKLLLNLSRLDALQTLYSFVYANAFADPISLDPSIERSVLYIGAKERYYYAMTSVMDLFSNLFNSHMNHFITVGEFTSKIDYYKSRIAKWGIVHVAFFYLEQPDKAVLDQLLELITLRFHPFLNILSILYLEGLAIPDEIDLPKRPLRLLNDGYEILPPLIGKDFVKKKKRK